MDYTNRSDFMNEVLSAFYDFIITSIESMGIYGPIFASLLIVLESILPPLPLCFFITINFLGFGKIGGFFISWICTILGCMISFLLTKKGLSGWIRKFVKDNGLIDTWLSYIKKLSLSKLTIVLSIPFTPAFLVNIAAGLSRMDTKKFFVSIVISKIFIVLFWGLVGSSFVESLKNPIDMLIIGLMIVIAYLLSLIINKLFKIN